MTKTRGRRLDKVADAVIIAAMTESGAILSDAARLLALQGIAVSRSTLSRYVANSPKLDEARKVIELGKIDYAEKVLWTQVEAKDGHAVRFFLGSKARDRGFGKAAVEVTTKPPEPQATFDYKALLDEGWITHNDLRLMETLMSRCMRRKSVNDDAFVKAGVLEPHPLDSRQNLTQGPAK